MASAYYLYLGNDSRIIGIRPYREHYVPQREFRFFLYDKEPEPRHFEDMYNYGVNVRDNETIIVIRGPCSAEAIEKCKKDSEKLEILENFENYKYNYTRSYAKNPIEMMYDFFLLAEIADYNSTGNVGIMLAELHQFDRINGYTIGDTVAREMMKLQDKKNMLNYINTQNRNLTKLLSENRFDEARSSIKNSHISW